MSSGSRPYFEKLKSLRARSQPVSCRGARASGLAGSVPRTPEAPCRAAPSIRVGTAPGSAAVTTGRGQRPDPPDGAAHAAAAARRRVARSVCRPCRPACRDRAAPGAREDRPERPWATAHIDRRGRIVRRPGSPQPPARKGSDPPTALPCPSYRVRVRQGQGPLRILVPRVTHRLGDIALWLSPVAVCSGSTVDLGQPVETSRCQFLPGE